MNDARESYYDPTGRAVIVMGRDHLGLCPECHEPIIEISQSLHHLKTAKCARGHRYSNLVLLFNVCALTPTSRR